MGAIRWLLDFPYSIEVEKNKEDRIEISFIKREYIHMSSSYPTIKSSHTGRAISRRNNFKENEKLHRKLEELPPIVGSSIISDVPDTSSQRLDLSIPNDSIAGHGEQGEDFKKDFLNDSTAYRFSDARPQRFRMKQQITVKVIVREFGKLAGLWPPGYTDDPCPAIKRSIDAYSQSGALDERSRELLKDTVAVRQRFCQ